MQPIKDFRELERYLTPSNPAQEKAEQLFAERDVLLLTGPSGTGKTHVAIKCCLKALEGCRQRRSELRIILTRPTVEVAGERLGYFPGDLRRKLGPWMEPISDVLRSLTNLTPQEAMKEMEPVPLSTMRGRSFPDCIAVLDEAQNCTWEQLELFVLRLGKRGKVIICGDSEQADLPPHLRCFDEFVASIKHLPFVGHVAFTDDMAVRSPHTVALLGALRAARLRRAARRG